MIDPLNHDHVSTAPLNEGNQRKYYNKSNLNQLELDQRQIEEKGIQNEESDQQNTTFKTVKLGNMFESGG